MDKSINVAVHLAAVDRASAVIAATVNTSIAHLQRLKAVSEHMTSFGSKSMAIGAAAAVPIVAAGQAYANQERSYIAMKTSLMTDGARIDNKQLAALDTYTTKSIAMFGYSKQANMDMVKVFLDNGATVAQILGGMGNAVQQLGVAFDVPAADAAQFASRMSRDMGIAAAQMPQFMDQINRLHMIGVGKTGSEAVTEMNEAFSKAGLAASVLGPKAQGLQAAKDLGATMAIFIKRGFSGDVVGTDFYKILMGMAKPDKMKKVNEALFAANGQKLNFFDSKGQFAGYTQMVGELNKLQGLSISQISTVLKPFANKSGPIAGILASLAEKGTEGYNANQQAMSKKATLAAINKEIMAGIAKQEQVTKNLAIATAGSIGKTYAADIKSILHSINTTLTAIDHFTQKHQTLTKVIVGSIATFSALAAGIGAVSYVGGNLWKGWTLLTTVMGSPLLRWIPGAFSQIGMAIVRTVLPAIASFTASVWANAAAWLANPATYIILAVIAAIAALIAIGKVVYDNWDAILSWFEKKWVAVKAIVSGMIAVFALFSDVVVGVGKALVGVFTFDPSMIVEGARQAAVAVSKIAHGGIKTAFVEGAAESLRSSNARINRNGDVELNVNKVKPNAGTTVNHNNHTTLNVHFHGVNPGDHADTSKHLKGVMDKWFRDKKANELRLGHQ